VGTAHHVSLGVGADEGHSESGQTAQCLYCLRKALKINPTDVDTLYDLASIYRMQKQTTKVTVTYLVLERTLIVV